MQVLGLPHFLADCIVPTAQKYAAPVFLAFLLTVVNIPASFPLGTHILSLILTDGRMIISAPTADDDGFLLDFFYPPLLEGLGSVVVIGSCLQVPVLEDLQLLGLSLSLLLQQPLDLHALLLHCLFFLELDIRVNRLVRVFLFPHAESRYSLLDELDLGFLVEQISSGMGIPVPGEGVGGVGGDLF